MAIIFIPDKILYDCDIFNQNVIPISEVKPGECFRFLYYTINTVFLKISDKKIMNLNLTDTSDIPASTKYKKYTVANIKKTCDPHEKVIPVNINMSVL